MMRRAQIMLTPEEHRQATRRAAEADISLAEYIRRPVRQDVEELPKTDRLGQARIEHVTSADLERAWSIGESFADQRFSIVDRTSFAVMERLGVHRVITFDDDFAIHRFGRRRDRALEVLRWGIALTRRVVHPVNAMDRPVQVTLDPERRRRARRRAAEQGLTLSDYIAGLVEADLEAWTPKPGAPAIIPIEVDPPTDHEGTYIGEAVAARMNKPAEPET